VAAADWYAERGPIAAEAFVKEIEKAVHEVSNAPSRWPLFVSGTRRFLLRRFPYYIVYRERGDAVEIIAVAHARRRPGYWKFRWRPH
jgi:plasmid stabilization system protein ParE